MQVVYNHDLILEMGVSLETEKNKSRYEHQADVQDIRDVSSIKIALGPQMIRKHYNHLRPGSEVFSKAARARAAAAPERVFMLAAPVKAAGLVVAAPVPEA